jgi:hypothetical protein
METKASKAWIINPTVSGVKREVQCLLKIGILAKDNLFKIESWVPPAVDRPVQRVAGIKEDSANAHSRKFSGKLSHFSYSFSRCMNIQRWPSRSSAR